jgi:hypothetical protein
MQKKADREKPGVINQENYVFLLWRNEHELSEFTPER